jgi:dienelactone hydrolase
LVFATFARAETLNPWTSPRLFEPPQVYPAPGFEQEGLEAIFYEGPMYEGKPTRVFAYIGMPPHAPGEKVPAMVLVHGGGGTAFPEWVKLWNARGYAAIAMDNCGCLPGGEHNQRPRAEQGGPPGWGGFDQLAKPPEEQWTFHAVADALLAHSLIRARPEVDAERVGLTGISWGGYLTCIIAGVDPRFKFAASVYGCGFQGEDGAWKEQIAKLGPAGQEWLERWDPAVYLPLVRVPMLWVSGTNDFAYPMDSLQKSYRLPQAPHTLSIRVRMPHGHPSGEKPEEIHAFADQWLKGGPPLARVSIPKVEGGTFSVTYEAAAPPVKAELNFTRDAGAWKERTWETAPASVDGGTVTADLPEGARVIYVNLVDAQGLVVSSKHVELR